MVWGCELCDIRWLAFPTQGDDKVLIIWRCTGFLYFMKVGLMLPHRLGARFDR